MGAFSAAGSRFNGNPPLLSEVPALRQLLLCLLLPGTARGPGTIALGLSEEALFI